MGVEIFFTNDYQNMETDSEIPWPFTTGVIRISNHRYPGKTERKEGFGEVFFPSLQAWAYDDYMNQWQEAFQRLREGKSVSCLILSFHIEPPKKFLQLFGLWRIADEYMIQEQYRSSDDFPPDFDPRYPYNAIGQYSPVTEDGEMINDNWAVLASDFQEKM
jgi:hypothetical protein